MVGGPRVPARVPPRRVVAAARTPALLAGAEVDPLGAALHAVLALALLRALHLVDGADVRARAVGHRLLLTRAGRGARGRSRSIPPPPPRPRASCCRCGRRPPRTPRAGSSRAGAE